MIAGVVTANREATISLAVRGPAGVEQQIDAVVDTGFDGWFTLPPAMIALLGLQWRRRGRALLADGSECVFDIYEITVEWDGSLRRIVVDEASTATLVGMALLSGLRVKRPSPRRWKRDYQSAPDPRGAHRFGLIAT